MADKKSVLITVLVLVIVILAGILIYAFVIRPAYTGYVVERQTEGVQIAVNAILTQLQQNGFVQIPIGNQTLILVPYTAPSTAAVETTPAQ
ncbi:MAG: hypothetical protein NTW17_02590 [Candidatus Pacearchaeota archaeon]|nr:hypothetical protein [Candidatus Pacearchaeota archaeon]